MREVEYLEISATPDKAERADHHEGQYDDERHSGGVGEPSHQAEDPGPGGEQPVPVTPPGPTKGSLASFTWIINQKLSRNLILYLVAPGE